MSKLQRIPLTKTTKVKGTLFPGREGVAQEQSRLARLSVQKKQCKFWRNSKSFKLELVMVNKGLRGGTIQH